MEYQLQGIKKTTHLKKQLKELLAWLETPAAAEALGDQWTPGDEIVEDAKWQTALLLKRAERREGAPMSAALVAQYSDVQNAYSEFMKSNQ
jgi:hypothetical protein